MLSASPTFARVAKALAVPVVMVAMVACNEPLDCGTGPGRCLKPTKKRTVLVDPKTYKAPLYKLENPPPRDTPPTEEPAADEKAVREPPPEDNRPLEGQQRGKDPAFEEPTEGDEPPPPEADPTRDVELSAQVVHRSRRTPEALLRRIVNVAANHNLPGLKRFATPRLQASMSKSAKKHPTRFWRHLDRYAEAAADGFEIEQSDGPRPGTTRLVVTTRTGQQLNPIVAKDKKGWLFDRF